MPNQSLLLSKPKSRAKPKNRRHQKSQPNATATTPQPTSINDIAPPPQPRSAKSTTAVSGRGHPTRRYGRIKSTSIGDIAPPPQPHTTNTALRIHAKQLTSRWADVSIQSHPDPSHANQAAPHCCQDCTATATATVTTHG